MAEFDWSASGIKNEFSFECVDTRSPNVHICWLDGITGGKITQTYRGDYRVSATLDFDGTEIPKHCAIRIWHKASLNGEVETEELATLIPQSTSNNLSRGRITGSLDLYSAMRFLDNDLLPSNMTFNKGKAAWEMFQSLCGTGGFSYVVDSGIQSTQAKLASAWICEHGKSRLTAMQKMADVANGYIVMNTHGQVCLQPYVNPSKAATNGDITTEVNSLILLGVDISTGDICNKVIASYETGTDKNKNVYTAEAKLAANHPWSFQSLGYWATQEANSPTFSDKDSEDTITAQLQKTVDKALAQASSYTRTFGVNMLYTPRVRVGQAYNLFYQDSDNGEKISANVFVSQKEINLDAAMECSITCEERWTNEDDTTV